MAGAWTLSDLSGGTGAGVLPDHAASSVPKKLKLDCCLPSALVGVKAVDYGERCSANRRGEDVGWTSAGYICIFVILTVAVSHFDLGVSDIVSLAAEAKSG